MMNTERKIPEIIGGGHWEDFLEFIRENPETETARMYRTQTRDGSCWTAGEFPDIPSMILINFVAEEDWDHYLDTVCDVRDVVNEGDDDYEEMEEERFWKEWDSRTEPVDLEEQDD